MNDDLARTVLDALPSGIAAFDQHQRLVYWNAALLTLSGVDETTIGTETTLPELVRLLAYRGLYGSGDPETLVSAVLRVDRSRPTHRITRGASGRWFELTSLPLADGGFLSCATEITAQKRAEAEARDRAAQIDSVLQALREGVALFDPRRRLTVHNAAYGTLMGASPGMLDDHPTMEVLDGRLREAGEIPPADSAGRPTAEDPLPDGQRDRPNGQVIRQTRTPLTDGSLVVEVNDITALKRTEEEARRRAALLDGVLGALPHGVCVYGADRRLAMFNEAYARIMEDSPVSIGEHYADIVRRRAEAGEYGPGNPENVVRIQLGFPLRRPQARQRVRPNGTALDIRTAPLPDGGHLTVITDITSLYSAEEEARQRTAILETMLETMRHGIMLFGPDRRLITANGLAARLAGHGPHALEPGRPFDELMRELFEQGVLGDGPEAEALLSDALTLDRSVPARRTQRGFDGRILEVASDPTPDGGFVVTHVDITPLAFAEEEAQRRAELIQSMLDNVRLGIVLFGADRRVIACNALAARLGVLPPGALRTGRLLDEIVSDAVMSGHFMADSAMDVLIRERHTSHRYRRRRPDGVMIELTSDPTPDGGFVITVADVTNLAAAEDEAERRTGQLRAMLDNIHQGVALFDADRRIIASNALAASMIGLGPEEMRPGVSAGELERLQAERGEFGSPEQAARAQHAQRSEAFPSRYVRQRPNGRMLEVATDQMPDGGFIRTYSDVTDDHRARTELAGAREAAEEANRARTDFMVTLGGELRAPLNAIIDLSETLLRAGTRDVESVAGAIRDAGAELRALMDDLLDMARVQAGHLAIVLGASAPASAARAAARAAQGAIASAGVAFALDAPDGLPDMLADERRLRQALTNLLIDAARSAPPDGRIALAVESEGTDAILFRVSCSDADPTQGRRKRGAASRDGDATPGGLGIGLHLSRVLVEAQGGTLTLTEVGAATLRMPVARATAAALKAPGVSA